MLRITRSFTAAALLALVVTVSMVAPASAAPRLRHVWVIVLENHSIGQIIGNPQSPYLNTLARRNGLATRYYSLGHPSLPNYLGLISGSSQGCSSDTCHPGYRAATITRQLSNHGLAWRGYFQGLPSPGYVGGDRGPYVQHHNPFAYFKSITSSRRHRANIRPFSNFPRSLRHPPAFSLIVPDNNHNMHTGSIRESDRWLHYWVPKITNTRAFHHGGVVFITYDEGHNDSSGCCVPGVHGGRTMLIALTAHRHRIHLTQPRSAYSLLRTIESGFRLSPLANAARVRPLNNFWR